MKKTFTSAEIVKTAAGVQYHIGAGPGDLAPNILLCGDPDRAEKVSTYFDKVNVRIKNREYVTITGTYQGIPTTVMATGIGCDNTEIAVIEVSQTIESPTLIRIGSCGALPSHISLGELVISTGAVRLENTSLYYVPDGYPAIAHHEVILALMESARNRRFPHHVGLTACAPGFYGAQARNVPGFSPRFPNLPAELEAIGVLNFEMETSTLFTLASLRGIRSGAVCAVYANRHHNVFIDTETKELAERRCIETGLGAVEILWRMDKARNLHRSNLWYPSFLF